jgi:type IV secretion system protein VirD4
MTINRFGIPYGYDAATETFPSYVGDRHASTTGPTRSGKGAAIIVPALLRMPHSVVVNDPKGQNAAITIRARRAMGQDVFVLNPFGLHTGEPWRLPRHRYNPLSRLRLNDPNVVAQTAALGQALILTQGKEPYFDDTARDLVSTIMLHMVATHGTDATLGHVRRVIAQISARHVEAEALFAEMARSPYNFIRQPIARFQDPEARDINAAINTALTQTAFLEDPALTSLENGTLSGSDLDFQRLKRRPTSVFIVLPGMLMEAYSRFLRLIITSAIDSVTSETGGHPVVMLLDEAARLEALPALTSAMGFAAGFNLQIHSFWQDKPQLERSFGPNWMTVIANCGMTQFFTPADIDTAEYIQRRGGSYTAPSKSASYAGRFIRRKTGESRGETQKPLLPIERTMSLPEDQSLVFFAGHHSPLLVGRRPYWEIPRLRRLYDIDPYHMP